MPSFNYDQQLLKQVKTLGNYKRKTDAVNAALLEYVHRREQPKIIKLFGKIEYDTDYNYKKSR